MPLLPENTNLEFAKTPQQAFPPLPAETPAPAALDVAAAALRAANVAGAAWERLGTARSAFETTTEPDVAGFDPVDHIPAGYEHFGESFLDAKNQQQVEDIRQRIQQELSDKQVIARAGGWGTASTFAAGLTDPLTIASMAIPVGGATRLAQAARLAAVNAGVSASQELAQHQVTETRTFGESVLNIGASAVLSGLLGAAIAPNVPKAKLNSLRTQLAEEGSLGPATGSVIDDRLRPPPLPDPEASNIASGIRAALGKREADLRAVVEGPEGQRAAGLIPNDVARDLQASVVERDRLAASLMEGKEAQIAAKAAELTKGTGVLESLRRRYAMTDVSSVVNVQATATVEAQRAATQEALETAQEKVRIHQGDADLLAKVEGARIDLEQHQFGIKEAEGKGLSELAQVLPEGQRNVFEKRISQLPIPEIHEIDGLPHADTGLPNAASESEFISSPSGESAVGAAAVRDTGIAGQTVARGARTLVEGPIGRVAPFGRIFSSPSLKARQLLENLANIGPALEKNYQGIATANPIERLLWRAEGTWQQAVDARLALFKTYRDRLKALGESPLNRSAFGQEVVGAMRNGDQHAIPEVSQAAQKTRAIVFNPLYKRAKKLGLLPEEAQLFADSYMTRQYNRQAIQADMVGWSKLLKSHFVGQGMDSAEADSVVHQVTRNVLGSERGTMDWRVLTDPDGNSLIGQSGRMKERTLSLPDNKLTPYLNNDIDHLTHSYLRSMAPEVEMTERFGSRDLKEQISDIKDEYAVLKQQRLAAGDSAGAVALDKQLTSDLQDLSAVRDRLYGIYGQPSDPGSFAVRAGRLLRQNNVLRLLGGATLSHIPDIANVITRYGLPQTFQAIGRLATSMEAMQTARAEAHRLGAALDMAMNTISVLGDFGSHSQFPEQRIAGKITRAFTIATGETPFITLVQNVASAIGQHEILTTAEKIAAGQAVDKNLLIRMAQGGLDQPMLGRIAAEAATNGKEVNGLKFGMSDIWKDQGAAQAFESAILKDAHGMTLRPGAADTPLFMSTEAGKLLLQFKTFAFAAGNTVVNPLMQGLARGDPRAMMGLMTLLAAGATSYMSKQTAAGQPIEFDNPGRFALEMLDKSNLMSWTSEAIFPALWQLGFKDLSRWSDRDPIETLLGPSIGTVTSAAARQLPFKMFGSHENPRDDFNRSDLHFVRRTFGPGQNVWWARRSVNDLEDHIGNVFDLSGKSNEQRALERAQ